MKSQDQAILKAEFFCLLDDIKFQATPRLEFTDQVRNGAVLFKHHLISPSWSNSGMLMGDALCIVPTQKFRNWIKHGIDIVRRREAWREEIGLDAAQNPTDDLLIAHPLIRYAVQKDPELRQKSLLHRLKDVLIGTVGLPYDTRFSQFAIHSADETTKVVIPGTWPESMLSAVAGKYLHEIVEFPSLKDPYLMEKIAGLKIAGADHRDSTSQSETVSLHLSRTQWIPLKGKTLLLAHQNHPYFA